MEPLSPHDRRSVDLSEQVLVILSRYVTRTIAQSVVTVARSRARMPGTQLSYAQLTELLEPLERGMVVFVRDRARVAECQQALVALAGAAGAAASPSLLVVQIRLEDDIARARTEARNLAGTMGFTLSGQTRLVTMVSELARNIVQYAKEGRVELKPTTAPKGVEIVAHDRGPGIPNLDVIMAGNYRSKLGMGLGLLGVKRLADPFSVETAQGRGTTVRAFLKLA